MSNCDKRIMLFLTATTISNLNFKPAMVVLARITRCTTIYLPWAKVVAKWRPHIPVLWALHMMTDGELPLSASRVGY